MKQALLFSLIFFAQILQAQTFTESPQNPPFPNVTDSSVAFADVNGDNHQDILITGGTTTKRITKLYLNDGVGNFIEKTNTPFEDVNFGSVAFADVNGDNHQDVIISGEVPQKQISNLYLNDGLGNFTKKIGTPFVGVSNSSIAFADVNGDNHQDVLTTGFTQPLGSRSTKLYLNDGLGNFTESSNSSLENVYVGSVAFADIDGNQSPDVIITGINKNATEFSRLYKNDGNGNFTKVTDSPIVTLGESSVAFVDIDGDMDQDLVVTGRRNTGGAVAKLYKNNGEGKFTEEYSASFVKVTNGSIALADVNGDQTPDLLLTGQTDSEDPITKLYLNAASPISSTNDSEGEFGFDFSLSPNPTSDFLFIKNSQWKGLVEITAINGQVVKKVQVVESERIDVSDLSPGCYFISFGKEKVMKFIKK